MKIHKNFSLSKVLFASIFGAAIVATVGCDKKFAQLNIDQNAYNNKVIQFERVFAQIELTASGNSDGYTYEDERTNLAYCSLMIQHFASTYYNAGDKYSYDDEKISAFWQRQYLNPIKNVVDLTVNTANNPKEVNLYNIARIFKAFMFQRMTDLYGDVPYSEAGLAFIGKIKFPKYDKQQDIYGSLLSELNDAASKLDTTPSANTLGNEDIIYGGDVSKWKKFAYSEMARLAMRMTKVDPTNAQKWIQIAYAGGAMATNDDNAIVIHIASTGNVASNNGSGFVLVTQDNLNFQMSKTFIDFFNKYNDPRLRYYSTKCQHPDSLYGNSGYDYGDTTPAVQLGMPNGFDPPGGKVDISKYPNYPGDIKFYSVPNRYTFARPDAPTFFLTAAETQFMFAEAAERGWLPGQTAAALYQTGVELAFSQLVQTGADWSTSDATSQADSLVKNFPYNSGPDGIRQINEQYWVAVFMDEYEAFANWRRSGYPILTPVNYPVASINVTGGTIPRRLQYPQNEVSVNTANYLAASALLSGGDKLTSRMWWDKP